MIKITYNEAVAIQAEQAAFYRRRIGRRGWKNMINATVPCPPDLNPDKLISVFEINKLVPRGGWFENQFWGNGKTRGDDLYYLCQAMKSNKIYH